MTPPINPVEINVYLLKTLTCIFVHLLKNGGGKCWGYIGIALYVRLADRLVRIFYILFMDG